MNSKSTGIIIIILIAGGFFFYKYQQQKKADEAKKIEQARLEQNNQINYEITQLIQNSQGVYDTLELCKQARTYRINRIDSINSLIATTKYQIATDSIEITNYLSEHKMAVACMAGGYVGAKVATDFNTEYPKVVEDLAGWGIVIAIGYYIFNKDEVDEVVKRTNNSTEKKKILYTEIDSYNGSLATENYYRNDIANIQSNYENKASEFKQKIFNLQQSIAY
jgi:hypothetical protein